MSMDYDLGNDGGKEAEASVARLKGYLDEVASQQGVAISMTPGQLSLMARMLTAPEEYRKVQFFFLADFLDEEEAKDHVDAFFEALELGMDTMFNVAYVFALAACNRKSLKVNRVAAILDALQHVKYTANIPKGASSSPPPMQPKSPLSS